MQKLLNWLDKYVLAVGVGLLLLFIPLYPKLPLLDVLQTWVYIRLEDFVVAAVVGAWLVQIIRHRVSPKTPLTWPILFYWFIGGLSLLFALVFLRSQMTNFVPHLGLLHYFRRIEYLVVFLVAASTIKDLGRVKHYLLIAGVALALVCLYGFGQKFFGWPAFLTMNEEFAKGIPLRLPPTARMASTFAGHYDLAAYLVLMIPLFASLLFGLKKRVWQLATFFLILASYLLLLFTGSRISLAVYLVAISLTLFLQKKKWLILPVVLVSLLLMSYVSQTTERFSKTFRVEDVVYDVRTGKPIAAVEQGVIEEELPFGTGFIQIPLVETEPPEATQQAIIRKSLRTASRSAEIATISGEFLIKRAIVYDISFTTRFQGTWPRALKAFYRNPLLGSGYSSVDVGSDSSYFRALGETGLLGFAAFLSLFFFFGLLVKQGLKKITSPFGRSLLIGMAAGTVGLMLNAILIDVFEASKVAFNFWLLLGISAGMINHYLPKRQSLWKETFAALKSAWVPLVLLTVVAALVFLPSLGNYFSGDDYVWLRWAYKTKIGEVGQFYLDAQGFFYRPLAKTYFVLVKPLFGLRPGAYHLMDFFLHFGCTLGAYGLALKLTKKKLAALLAALLFLIHPINAESVLWISSTSALMASFFYFGGVLAYLQWRQRKKDWQSLYYLAALITFALGLLSHERMITFPLLLLFYDFLNGAFQRRKAWGQVLKTHLPFWLITAGYFWLRNGIAHAHGLSGDYNYNLQHLPFNLVGNFFGYLGELTVSFHFLPWYDLSRGFLRTQPSIALVLLLAFGLFLAGGLFLKKQKNLKINKTVVFAFGWFIILLLPFLGLGNMAERHVYPAHFGFFLLLALFINWLYEKIRKINLPLALGLTLILCLFVFGFYQQEMEKAKKEWFQAGEIANKILLAVSSNYIEFAYGNSLYFVNPPMRQGRAWIYPVGIPEGLWFIYRDETLPIKIVTNLEETLEITKGDIAAHIFVYEEGELMEIKR